MGKKIIDMKTLTPQLIGAGSAVMASKVVNEGADKLVEMLSFIPAEMKGVAKGVLKIAAGAIGPGMIGKGKNSMAIQTGGHVFIGEGVRDVVNGFKPGFLSGTEDEDMNGIDGEDDSVDGLPLANESYNPESGVGGMDDAVG